MKKTSFAFLLAVFAGSIFFISCDKEEKNDYRNTDMNAVMGRISSSTTWSRDKIYLLVGRVVVNSGVTLTIEAGTIIKGKRGTGVLASALIIARGAKIKAVGTAQAPIIMTSEFDNITIGEKIGTSLRVSDRGFWGGLVLLGNAPISSREGDEHAIEGIPASDPWASYGGSDTADNSGILKYVSVRHAGVVFGSDNELNGITLGGVGNGTVVSHVEVFGNEDDGIEFFGGSVNVKYALIYGQGDDGYDIDQAWSGTLEEFVQISTDGSNAIFEIDGPESSGTNDGGRFTIKNGTCVTSAKQNDKFLAQLKSGGAQGEFNNVLFKSVTDQIIELTDSKTSVNYHMNNKLNFTGVIIISSASKAALLNDAGGGSAANAAFETIENSKIKIVETIPAGVGVSDKSEFDWTAAVMSGASF